MSDIDDPRREFLIKALSAGMYALASGIVVPAAYAMGKIPSELPPGKSIYDLVGQVRVDGKPANMDTFIGTQSTVETGDDSRVIFVVGKDAFILRENGKLQLQGSRGILSEISVVAGKLLSVFGKRQQKQTLGVRTVAATIGIRGTGVYVESQADQSYVCTCYGVADLASTTDAKSHEQVTTVHHDAPRYIFKDGPIGQKIQPAPVINHTDEELALIEALVGRTVPFAAGGYSSPRKTSY